MAKAKVKEVKGKAVKAKAVASKAATSKKVAPKAVKAKVVAPKAAAKKAVKSKAATPKPVAKKAVAKKAIPSKTIASKPVASNEEKTRYNDKELAEFRKIIDKKLAEARKELSSMQDSLTNPNNHGTDDTGGSFKMLEDGSDSLAKEELSTMAIRQKKFIEQLENALIRIENKTYGICRVTGKLIPAERLRAVPHTTQSIEAKNQQYKD